VNEEKEQKEEGEKDLIELIEELSKLGYSVEGFSKKDEYPHERITLELVRYFA
jgi:hypothetical protein